MPEKLRMKVLSVEDCKGKLNVIDVNIIDIRENWEHAIYAIGIKHIPMAQLVEKIKELDNSKETILVCKSGKRAEALANLMETEHGFSKIAIMDGGITAWAHKFDPTNELY